MTSLADVPRDLRHELTGAGLDLDALWQQVAAALAEDLPRGQVDTTTVATIPADQRTVAELNAREQGVVAGLGVAALVLHAVNGQRVSVRDRVADGTVVHPGDHVMTVTGPTRGLLTAERTALNFAGHLSGVATATAAWVEALSGT
ncbi:MAG: nicotinate-nucleotide diphosphorylase, partial [Marmoricola sp.]